MASGKVSHIVFHPDAPPGSYFPSADHRVTALSPLDPRPGRRDQRPAATPVHSIAAGRLREVYEVDNGRHSVDGPLNGFLKVVYPSSCAGTVTCSPTSTLRGPGR